MVRTVLTSVVPVDRGDPKSAGRNATSAAAPDDFSRDVYCILGVPIDAIEIPEVLRRLRIAAANVAPFVLSTPNLNFLVNSQNDSEFRESLLASDLCTADGMPIIWIARLIATPIKRRAAGSDMFDALKGLASVEQPLKLFLFGSTDDAAAAAARALSVNPHVLQCVGWICPGFGTVDDLSQDQFIHQINSSGADFLVVALGAQKGQLWLLRNHHRLKIPIRAHLGATINFQAGTVKRAPYALRKLGFEWLWRIWQEPHLWQRYWHDGRVFLRLTFTRVLPLAIDTQILRWKDARQGHNLVIDKVENVGFVSLRLSGFAIARHVESATRRFKDAAVAGKRVVIDLSSTHAIDARFLGLLLMLRKQLKARGQELEFVGMSGKLERTFRLNGLEYLLALGDHS